MKHLKLIAIISVLLAVCLICAVILPPFFDYGNGEIYSPIGVASPSSDPFTPDGHDRPENFDPYVLSVQDILKNKNNLETSFSYRIDEAFIEKMRTKFGAVTVEKLAEALMKGKVSSADLINVIGYTEKAFLSILDDNLDRTTVLENTADGTTDLVFVGDVSFADGYSVINSYKARKKGVEGIVSKEVLEIMRSASITMANNEFTFTKRGAPVPNKKYTFRSNPDNVSIYHEMGVDIVGMANNHAFDYGPDSLTDTIATLDKAGIAHVGAGNDLDEAKAPYFYISNGYKIAIVAGSNIDPNCTRGATADQSGVFQIFDMSSMLNEITAAKEQADYVIVYVHWGYENKTGISTSQNSYGKAFVDAGADLVVGMHSHCMQGVEYYKGKLIVYSLGNFTFSSFTLTCGMLKTSITKDGELKNVYYPMMQKGNRNYITAGEEGKAQLESFRNLSINASIADDFTVTVP